MYKMLDKKQSCSISIYLSMTRWIKDYGGWGRGQGNIMDWIGGREDPLIYIENAFIQCSHTIVQNFNILASLVS